MGEAVRRSHGRRLAISCTLLLALASAFGPPSGARSNSQADSGSRLGVYQGLGTWIDIYDESLMRRPQKTVAAIASHRVQTIYLETSNYRSERAVVWPGAVSKMINSAHRRGIRVVAWYLPSFKHLDRDFRRSMRAIRFRSSTGERFDSFALDIESPEVANPARRTRRLLRLSRRLRDAVGNRYPLGATIPSPRGMRLSPSYWPGFPYKRLARRYDVFLPMAYFTYRVNGRDAVYDYTRRCFRIIKRETGRPRLPIHAIGGIAEEASRGEVRGFARAVTEQGAIGAGLYDFGTTGRGDWRAMARARYRVP